MNKSRITRMLSLLVAIMMFATLVVGCGDNSDKQKESTSTVAATTTATTEGEATTAEAEPGWQKDTSPAKLTWYVHANWFRSQPESIEHQLIKEKTGIDLEFVIPVGDENQKLNTLIASNSLPDVLSLGWWEQQVPQLAEQGFVYPLNELADKYDPYFWKVAKQDLVNWYKNEDGNLYGYPNSSFTPQDVETYKPVSTRSFLVRKDIYEAIGKPDMTTPDGFLAAMKAAKEKFPKAPNGKPLIGFGTFNFGSIGNDALEAALLEFLAVPREIDGKFFDTRCGNPDPDYINWLKTVRKAHELGYYPDDAFVDDRTQIEEKIMQGRYFALLYQYQDALQPLGELYKNSPEQTYISVPGPKNSKGDEHKLGVSGYSGWMLQMITKNCKIPDRAIKFFSFAMSEEGQKTFFLGKEGVTYDMVDGKPVIKQEVQDMKNRDMGNFKQKYNTYNEYWFFQDLPLISTWEPAPVEPFKQIKESLKGKSWHYGVYDNNRPAADSDEGLILQKAENKWGEVLPKLLMAKTDAEFDKIWSDYDAFKKEIGYEKALEAQRGLIAKNKEKLGMK